MEPKKTDAFASPNIGAVKQPRVNCYNVLDYMIYRSANESTSRRERKDRIHDWLLRIDEAEENNEEDNDDKTMDILHAFRRKVQRQILTTELLRVDRDKLLADVEFFESINRLYEKYNSVKNSPPVHEYYETVYARLQRSLSTSYDLIHARLSNIILRYSSVDAQFFDYLVHTIMRIEKDSYSVADILIHVINYAPSTTLAQMYFFIAKNEINCMDLCEYCIITCSEDELFSRRTRAIINRFLSLGEQAAVQLLNKMCYHEFFLFPLCFRRRYNASFDSLVDTGECRAFNVLSAHTYAPIDMIRTCYHYITDELRCIDVLEEKYTDIVTNVFSLANMICWRYDGKHYVDMIYNCMTEIHSKNDREFENEFERQLRLHITSEGAMETDERNVVAYDDYPSNSGGTKRRRQSSRGGGAKKSRGGSASSLRKLVEKITEKMMSVLRNFTYLLNGGTKEGMPNVMRCSKNNSTLIETATNDKFVRYFDQANNKTIILNLYLNRFEHVTPAVTTLLNINYDDFQPPAYMRFNEVVDENILLFIRTMFERMPRYFQEICSRDAMDMYLHARVIRERVNRKERAANNTNDAAATSATVTTTTTTTDATVIAATDDATTAAATAASTTNDATNDDLFSTMEKKTNITSNFYCDVNDLLLRLPKMLTMSDIRNVLRVSEHARHFAILCINIAHQLGRLVLNRDDAAYGLVDLLARAEGDITRILYAPLSCRMEWDASTNTAVAVTADTYARSRTFLRKEIRDVRIDPFADYDGNDKHTDDLDETMKEGGSSSKRSNNNLTTVDRLRLEVDRYARAIKVLLPNEMKDFGLRDDPTAATRGTENTFVLCLTKSSSSTTTTTAATDRKNNGNSTLNADTIRRCFTSWELDIFARENEQKFNVKTCGLKDNELRNIVVTFLFLLIRERERKRLFGGEKQRTTQSLRTGNLFVRLERGEYEVALSHCISRFPKCHITSTCTNDLAKGLAFFVLNEYHESDRPKEVIAFAIAVALVSLYIFADGNMDVVRFFVLYSTAIRFPGQFLKSILLLIGTSDSGKSEFVSSVLRAIFSSQTGLVNNSTLRQANQNEINTDQMSLMLSHVCQCDEPEYLHAERFKNIISDTQFVRRNFFSQRSLPLNHMAKLIITTNDAVKVRGDAGVITRMKYCYRATHKFKELLGDDESSRYDFLDRYATRRVAHQFATRVFPKGVNYFHFGIGLFTIIQNYGLAHCTYTNERTFLLGDGVASHKHKRQAQTFWTLYRARALEPSTCDEKNEKMSSVISNDPDLQAPIVLDVPKAIADEAGNLHRSIDPFELLRHHYTISQVKTRSISETTLTTKLLNFLEENNYFSSMPKSNSHDVVRKLKERLRTEYPTSYCTRTNVFFLSFRTKT